MARDFVYSADLDGRRGFVEKVLKSINQRAARSLTTVTGGMVLLAVAAKEAFAEAASLATIDGIASYAQQADGSVQVVLDNGQTVVVSADQVVSVSGDEIVISEAAVAEIQAFAAEAAASAGGAVPPAAYVALGAVALGAAGGGSGGSSGGEPTDPTITKTFQVVDAPLENALVFYDSNGDGTPNESEYLGLTDSTGALTATYEPVGDGVFIIVPAPVANAAADYGWSSEFAADFDGIFTRDVSTGVIFNQVLQANDVQSASDQVVSPVSTLIASGLSEEKVKEIFDLPEDLDLDSFNFFEALSSDDPETLAAAQDLAAASVAIASITQTALAIAETDGATDAAESQAIIEQAFQTAAQVLEDLPTGLSLDQITEATSSIVTSVAVDPTVDVSAATETLVAEVEQAIDDNPDNPDIAAAVETTAQTIGLDESQTATVTQTSAALSESAQNTEEVFANVTIEPGADLDEILAAVQEPLADVYVETADNVTQVVNETILGYNLVADTAEGTEGQSELIKGNVLFNDKLSDGSFLPAETTVHSVNGAVLPEETLGDEIVDYQLSTSGYTFNGLSASASQMAAQIGVSGLPAARNFGSATAGQMIYDTITVEAGDTISFDYTFSSRDYVPYNDYSFFALKATSGGTDAEQDGLVLRGQDDVGGFPSGNGLLDVADLKGPGYYTLAGSWVSESSSFTYTFEEAGTFEVGIGLTDARDQIVDSRLSVENIMIGGENADPFSALGAVRTDSQIIENTDATIITGYYGTGIFTENGDFLYQVGGANAADIPVGNVATDTFTYTVETDEGTFASQTLTVRVTGTGVGEDAPIISLSSNPTVNASEASAAVFSGNIENASDGTITVTISDGDESTDDVIVTGDDVVILPVEGTETAEFAVTADLSGLNDGQLTIQAQVSTVGASAGTTTTGLLDTVADADPTATLKFQNVNENDVQIAVSGLDADANITVTISDGEGMSVTSTTPASGDGLISEVFDITGFGDNLTVTGAILDQAGNTAEAEGSSVTQGAVTNNTQGTTFETISDAVAAADEGDVLALQAVSFDENVIIDKSLTILGAQSGQTANTGVENLDPNTGTTRAGGESTILGSVTVAADNVVLDGLTLDNQEAPLVWDESILTDTAGGLDGFALKNSIVFRYDASGAPTFSANTNDFGSYNGPAVANNWEFSGNLFGGVENGNSGSLQLAGIDALNVSDNMFWRPGAAHVYVNSVSNATFDENFFYHGVHGGGADFDGFASEFPDSGFGYGYGFPSGSGPVDNYYGRNFWIEFKGVNDTVSVTGNDGQFNSGGVQLFGEDNGSVFDNFTIDGNTFRDFVNADPEGRLEGSATRGDSGFGGAITVSVQGTDDNSASNIVISNNDIEVAADQIYSDRDQASTITVQGAVDGVTVTGNMVDMVAASSDEILQVLSDLGASSSTFEGPYAGYGLVGGLLGTAEVSSNSFIDTIGSEGGVYALYVLGETDDFGSLAATVQESGNTFPAGTSTNWAAVVVDSLPTTYDPDNLQLSVDFPTLFIAEPNGLVRSLLLSETGDDALVGNDGSNALYDAGGVDQVDVSAGGQDLVMVNSDAAANGTDVITGFTLGTDAGNADTLGFYGLVQSDLRGDGTDLEILSDNGATVGDNTGLLIFSNALGDGETIADRVEGLSGLEDGDIFFVMTESGDNVTLTKITMNGTEAETDGTLAVFNDVNIGDAVESNFAPFQLPEV